MWKILTTDNRWVAPILGLAGVIATFAFAGATAGIVGVFVLMLLAIGVLFNSLRLQIREPDPIIPVVVPTDEPLDRNETGADLGHEPEVEPPFYSDSVDAVDDPPDDPAMLGFRALTKGDPVGAQKHFDKYCDEAETPEDLVDRKAWTLRWLASSVRPSAIQDLEALRSENPSTSAPLRALAGAHSDMGDARTAAGVIGMHIEEFATEAQLELLIDQSKFLSEAHQYESSLAAAAEALSRARKPAETARAQAARGTALRGLDRQFEAFGAIEESLVADPSQKNRRFMLAYEYSQLGLDTLAVFHYQMVLRQYPDHSTARNNLGVQLSKLDVESAAVDEFKRAAASHEEYSPVNLARRLVDAGFLEEATVWIKQAQENKKPPEFTGAIASSIAAARENDMSARDEMNAEGDRLRTTVKEFAGSPDHPSPVGDWTIDGHQNLTFKANDEGQYVAESGEGKNHLKVTLSTVGNGSSVTWQVGQIVRTTHSGFATISGSELRGLLLDKPAKGRASEFVARRV